MNIKPVCNIHVQKGVGARNRYIGITVSSDKYKFIVNEFSTAEFVHSVTSLGPAEIISKNSNSGYITVSECFDYDEVFSLFESLNKEVE